MISQLAAADRPRWTELWRAYLAFYETQLSPAIFDHAWSRLMQGHELHAYAARATSDPDSEIIGITHFLYHPSAWTLSPVCYLQDLYVAPEARGKGTARALIEAVAAHARTQNAARLYWLTQDHNETARALYDRLAIHTGFIRYEYPPL